MVEALVFLADGSEEIESISSINILRRGGVNVKTVSITSSDIVTGSRNIKLKTDLTFNELNQDILDNTKIIIFPGGLGGYENFKKSSKLIEVVRKSIENGKYIAAICAAPSFLGENGFLKGIKATCYPGFEKNLIDAIPTNENVVVDKNFITGKGPGLSLEFGLKLLEVLKGEEIYRQVKEGLLL